jgi:CheY-like chemotaxis protein
MSSPHEIHKSDPNQGPPVWLTYLVLGIVATGMYFLLAGAAKDTLYNLIGASSLVGERRYRPKLVLPWYVIAIGLTFFVVADVTFYSVYGNVLRGPIPFPSVADAFYASSYIVVAVGLVLLIRGAGGRRYRADVAADGLEAIEALSRGPYAAVLMDVQMPEMDGYEATAELRRREEEEGQGRRTPIIAMTANALEGDRERAIEAGMDDYLPKPVTREELGAVLERWIPEGEALPELGGQEMLSELSEMFLDDASSALRDLKEAIESEDLPLVERTAHTLKGSSGNMGAKRMARICAELQDAGVSRGELSRAPELLGRLEAEVEKG